MSEAQKRSTDRDRRLRAWRAREAKRSAQRAAMERSMILTTASWTSIGVAALTGVVFLIAPQVGLAGAGVIASGLCCLSLLMAMRAQSRWLSDSYGPRLAIVATTSGILAVVFILIAGIVEAGA